MSGIERERSRGLGAIGGLAIVFHDLDAPGPVERPRLDRPCRPALGRQKHRPVLQPPAQWTRQRLAWRQGHGRRVGVLVRQALGPDWSAIDLLSEPEDTGGSNDTVLELGLESAANQLRKTCRRFERRRWYRLLLPEGHPLRGRIVEIAREDRHPLVRLEPIQQCLECFGRVGPRLDRIGPGAGLTGIGDVSFACVVVSLAKVGDDIANAEGQRSEQFVEDRRTENHEWRNQYEYFEAGGQRPFRNLILE